MAWIHEHCADCVEKLGQPFKEVHEWLDEFSSEFGPDHRDIRHNTYGLERAKELFGQEGMRAAEIHIQRDCHSRLVPRADSKSFQLRLAMKPRVYEKFIKEWESRLVTSGEKT